MGQNSNTCTVHVVSLLNGIHVLSVAYALVYSMNAKYNEQFISC